MYRTIAKLQRVIPRATLFKVGFNLSPMYRRSTGRVRYVSPDLRTVRIEIPLSWRNANYVGTMFGGSMLSATDPVLMVQLINILGSDYVVWDQSVEMRFRRPAKGRLFSTFEYGEEELEEIRASVRETGEMELVKSIELRDRSGELIASGSKVLYVADKEFRRQKVREKNS